MTHNFNGQSLQDKFVSLVLKNKFNGYFLEIGSNHPKNINNSYYLEKELNWSGIMVEYNNNWLESYKESRPNSIHIMNDATQVDYYQLLKQNSFPSNLDYLQIDLEVSNRSTLTTLELLNNTVFNEYKFATVTFEHDIYSGDYFNVRLASREIFINKGYILVFPDVSNDSKPYEDWYIHPDLVDIQYINNIKQSSSLDYNEIINILEKK